MPNVEIMLKNVSANCRQSLRYLIKYCIVPTECEWTLILRRTDVTNDQDGIKNRS